MGSVIAEPGEVNGSPNCCLIATSTPLGMETKVSSEQGKGKELLEGTSLILTDRGRTTVNSRQCTDAPFFLGAWF